jgi:hypothetical protein
MTSSTAVPAADTTIARHAVDPRGMRFAAAVTTVVLGVVLATQSAWLLAAQALVFAVGAFAGVRRSPYALLFARLVRPRLGPPTELEDARPARFAQLVGLVFALAGVIGLATGATTFGLIATALAFVAAFLNSVFGLCLGCELYLIGTRTLHRTSPERVHGRATTGTSTTSTTDHSPTTEVSA